MTYADNYNIRTTSVKFNDVADALDGLITRNYAGLTTGTSTTYIATPSPAWDAYTTSGLVVIIPHVTNTGAATINISGLGARDLRIGNTAIAAGVLQQNVPTIMAYTGTYFEVLLQQTAVPIGTIYTYAGSSAPIGYLVCDGTAYNTYTYRGLHAVVSNTYGGTAYSAGVTDQPTAVTTFQIPDLRRRSPVGKGASDTLGASDGVAYTSRSQSHSHAIPGHYHGLGTLATGTTGSDHSHGLGSLAVGSLGSGHGHGHSLSADPVGDHQHSYTYRNQVEIVNGGTGLGNMWRLTAAANTGFAGAHGHPISGAIGGTDGSHTHNVTGTIGGGDGTHTHNLTGSIGATASGNNGDASFNSNASINPHLIINFIIKH